MFERSELQKLCVEAFLTILGTSESIPLSAYLLTYLPNYQSNYLLNYKPIY